MKMILLLALLCSCAPRITLRKNITDQLYIRDQVWKCRYTAEYDSAVCWNTGSQP
jgi:hypothetical protein